MMRKYVCSVLLVAFCSSFCEAAICNCTNAICPSPGTLCRNGKVLGSCSCCFVCARIANEVCGGRHDILGKCEANLRCDYEGIKLESQLQIGFCKNRFDSSSEHALVDTLPSCSRKLYIDKKTAEDPVGRCYEDSCGKTKMVYKIPLSCLEIGCGIKRPLDSACCLMCNRDASKIICNSDHMKILVPKSTMSEDMFLNSSLIDPNCKGYESKEFFVFATKFHLCGTVSLLQKQGGQGFFNAVETTYREQDTGRIKKLSSRFSCTFDAKTSVQTFFKVKQKSTSSDISGIRLIFTSKGGRILNRKERFFASEKRLDVAVSSVIAKRYKLRIAINWCYFSESTSIAWANGKEHYLFKNGCIADNNVNVIYRKGHVIWFSYETKETALQGRMYLHCDINLCLKRSKSAKCTNTCM